MRTAMSKFTDEEDDYDNDNYSDDDHDADNY